jgi:hypothetical protein
MTSKIDTLNKQLKDIKEAYEKWQHSGLNEEVLIIYLQAKTKLSRKKVMQVLNEQQKFFDNLIKDEVVKRLEG